MTTTDPAAHEASGDAITITQHGVTLTLPATSDDWPADAVEALENNKAVTALRALLGRTQFAELEKAITKETGAKPLAKHYGAVLEAVAVEYGFVSTGE
jgi:hypothetical protein